MLSAVVCLFCLSAMFMHCGQTFGWIKLSLGTDIGLGPGHTVLDGNPAPHTERSTAAPVTFRPMSIVSKLSPISATAELFYLSPAEWRSTERHWQSRMNELNGGKYLAIGAT